MKIRIVGNPFSISGYSLHCRELMLALLNKKHNLCLDFLSADKEQFYDFPGEKLIKETVGRDNKAEISIQVSHPGLFKPVCKYNFGLFFFETSGLPKKWIESCNKMTAILAPSKFCYDICKESLSVPVYLAHGYYSPLAFDEKKFVDYRRIFGIADNYTIFLSIFQWTHRKGWDILLRSYWAEFNANDKVALIIKTYGQDCSPESSNVIYETVSRLKNSCLPRDDSGRIIDTPPVYFITDKLDDTQVASLYKSSDCFVLPTRGEGWGRTFLDALAFEKQVIATNWSAHTEFLNDDNAYLIDYVLEPCHGVFGDIYSVDLDFAFPLPHSLMKHMRSVEKGLAKKVDKKMAYEFNEARTVNEYIKAITDRVGSV